MENPPKLWRHGDVLIQEVDEIPEGFHDSPHHEPVLYRGDVSGHSHRFKDKQTVQVYRIKWQDQLFFEVLDEQGADLKHQEHNPIHFEKGFYRAWRQREFDSVRGSRWVAD